MDSKFELSFICVPKSILNSNPSSLTPMIIRLTPTRTTSQLSLSRFTAHKLLFARMKLFRRSEVSKPWTLPSPSMHAGHSSGPFGLDPTHKCDATHAGPYRLLPWCDFEWLGALTSLLNLCERRRERLATSPRPVTSS